MAGSGPPSTIGLRPSAMRSDAVAVSDVGMAARGLAGAARRVKLFDDAAEFAVADGLPMLGQRDDRAVDVVEIGDAQREAERLAAALHGVAPGMPAEDQARDRLPD